MRICTNCGTTNPDGVNLCKNCGSEIIVVNPVVVRTHYRRNKPATQKHEKPSDFNPVQHLQKPPASQNVPLQSLMPKVANVEYKFSSPSQIQSSTPLKSIPPTPVDNFVIPNPIQPHRRNNTPTPPKSYPVAQESNPIVLSNNTISNADLNTIPREIADGQAPSIQRVIVPHVNSQSASNSTFTHPIMAFSNQNAQSQQIEQEMTSIMSTLRGTHSSAPQEREELHEENYNESIPNSLDDILINLSQLDMNIEASALVKTNGEIIASAISERIDEFLISTITNTLGTISQDVIASLESGDLKFISIFATKGILFLSPIMKNLFLVLYTTSEAKIGLINLAKMVVKKKIEMYFAKQNLQKSPV